MLYLEDGLTMNARHIAEFSSKLLRPKLHKNEQEWAFVVLPLEVSEIFPRRGRTTANVLINDHLFQIMLEPDGNKSHWLKIDKPTLIKASMNHGDLISFQVTPVNEEPEPILIDELKQALNANQDAMTTWKATTSIAKVDWIHWITSAKQEKTKVKRVNDAVDMLAKGKKRVCCFDPSGFYSKTFSAPEIAAD